MRYGNHKATVDTVTFETLQDDREVIKVNLIVFPDGDEQFGMTATLWFTNDQAIGIAYARLRSIGFDVKTRALDELANNPELLRGTMCEVEIGDYNDRPQVKWFGQPKKKVEGSRLAALQNKIRAVAGTGSGGKDVVTNTAENIVAALTPPTPEEDEKMADRLGPAPVTSKGTTKRVNPLD